MFALQPAHHRTILQAAKTTKAVSQSTAIRPMCMLMSTIALATLTACGGGGGGNSPGVNSTPPPIAGGPGAAPAPSPAPAQPGPCEPNCPAVAPPEGSIITPQHMQRQRSVNDDAEYRRNFLAAEMTNALFALDNNWRGQGVRVGVIDDGVMPIGDLEGKVNLELSRDFGGIVNPNVVNGVTTPNGNTGDERSTHGTAVAAIIAGRRDGRGMQGFAPDAEIVALRSDFSFPDTPDSRGVGWALEDIISYANQIRLPIVNMSLTITGMEQTDIPAPVLPLINATNRYAAETRGLLVNSAGNFEGENPGFLNQITPENAASWLIVVALEPSTTEFKLANYSNRCGGAKARCVAAVGTHTAIDTSGNIITFTGTSAAAPQVAGLAATILSKWPQLTGQDAGNIILRTARDIGDPGVDAVFGHGIVDFAAALRPVNPTLSNGVVTTSLANTAMVLGSAFGGSEAGANAKRSSIQSALSNVAVLDEYGRDFTGNIAGMVVRPEVSRERLTRRIEAQARAGQAGFASPQGSAMVGYTAFETGFVESGQPVLRQQITNARVAMRLNSKTFVTAGFNSDNNVLDDVFGMAPASDAMFAYAPIAQTSVGMTRKLGKGEVALAAFSGERKGFAARGATLHYRQGLSMLKLGLADEIGTVFGTPVGTGLMRFGDGARTAFIEASSGVRAGAWSFDGYASLGATRLHLADDMLIDRASMILTNRFGVFARRSVMKGILSLGAAQDVVSLAGHADLTLGTRFDLANRTLIYENQKVSLAGQMRPQAVVGYEHRGDRSSFNFGAASDASGEDVRAVAAWQVRF